MSPHEHSLRSAPNVGDLILGRYELLERLGAGGMGVIYKALQRPLGRNVAIKFILSTANDPRIMERFFREARAAARINDPHVVTIHDCGLLDGTLSSPSPAEEPSVDGGIPFIVMEHMAGQDLSTLLKARGGALSLDEALRLLFEACIGVAAVHRQGTIHRDLKPSNLFLCSTDSGRTIVKVMDFGISRTDGLPTVTCDQTLTRGDAIIGSPYYMSPEQLRNPRNVDPRADIWSLGVILYELVSGARPFEGQSVADIFGSILADPPTPLQRRCPDAPEALDAIVDRCLQKNPIARYQDVNDLALALASLYKSGYSQEHVADELSVDTFENDVDEFLRQVGETSSLPPPATTWDQATTCLAALTGSVRGKTYPLVPSVIVGRVNPQSPSEAAPNIVLTETRVSRRHCRFFFTDGSWWVEDLGSMNGILVNGKKCKQRALVLGDRVLVGETVFKMVSLPASSLSPEDAHK